jgi:hypothetical protein
MAVIPRVKALTAVGWFTMPIYALVYACPEHLMANSG